MEQQQLLLIQHDTIQKRFFKLCWTSAYYIRKYYLLLNFIHTLYIHTLIYIKKYVTILIATYNSYYFDLVFLCRYICTRDELVLSKYQTWSVKRIFCLLNFFEKIKNYIHTYGEDRSVKIILLK